MYCLQQMVEFQNLTFLLYYFWQKLILFCTHLQCHKTREKKQKKLSSIFKQSYKIILEEKVFNYDNDNLVW